MRILSRLLLPIACAWVRNHEKRILRDGAPLNAAQLEDARRSGVAHPERIRIAVVESVPPRLNYLLMPIAGRLGVSPSATAGMALGYGIFIRSDCAGSRRLLLHELAHTAQYERLGSRAFLAQYLHECLAEGYGNGALEQEAQRSSAELA